MTSSPFALLPIEVWATLPLSAISKEDVQPITSRPASGVRFSALQLLAGVPRMPLPSPCPPASAATPPILSIFPLVPPAITSTPRSTLPELSFCLDSANREATARAVHSLRWPNLTLGLELRRPLLDKTPSFPANQTVPSPTMQSHRSAAAAPGAAFSLGVAWQAARGCLLRVRAGTRGAALCCDARWEYGPGSALLASANWSVQRPTGARASFLSLSAYARA